MQQLFLNGKTQHYPTTSHQAKAYKHDFVKRLKLRKGLQSFFDLKMRVSTLDGSCSKCSYLLFFYCRLKTDNRNVFQSLIINIDDKIILQSVHFHGE